ncbi:hypothetical protein PJ267_16280 [Arthrobacter sp. OVS8]|nr:hypothetical protein PJ267_16280 [Arthrobacter sp. OVS8]
MSSKNDSRAPRSKRTGIIRSVSWAAFFAVLAWLVVASWGLTFWPSVALFTVYTVGIAIPLGFTVGLLIPRGFVSRSERDRFQGSSHRDAPDTNA